MNEMWIDVNAVQRPSIRCAASITLYNRLADQDPELAQQMVEDLPSFRVVGRAERRPQFPGLAR